MQDEDRSFRVEDGSQTVLRDYGLGLVELEWHARRPRPVLRVFVDKPGGVAVGDCDRVSREVGDLIDVEGLIEDAYDLEVSSPGLDRLLRSDREFRRAVGKLVRLWQAGGLETRGRLADVTAERLVVERDGDRAELPRCSVTAARLDAEVPWPRRG